MTTVEVQNNSGIEVEVYLTRPAKSFNIVAVAGQDDVIAVNPNETLNLVAGDNIEITTDESTNTISFSSPTAGDVDGGEVL